MFHFIGYKLVKEMCNKEDIFIPSYKEYQKLIKKYKNAADEKESSIETFRSTDSRSTSIESNTRALETTDSRYTFYESSDEFLT